jgi:mannitol-specific phosphotransferase system IIBC component
MDLPNNNNSPTLAGTAGGTFLVVLLQVTSGALLQTIALAIVGAVVSFGTSLLCKRLLKTFTKKARKL